MTENQPPPPAAGGSAQASDAPSGTAAPDTPPSPPPGAPAGAPFRPRGAAPLLRSRQDRKIAGIAGGLGSYTGIDPLVFRIVLVVLAVFGGSGLLLYGLGWLFIPQEGDPYSEAQRLGRGRGTLRVLAAVGLAFVGLVMFGLAADSGLVAGGFVALAAIALTVYLSTRSAASGADWRAATTPGPGGPHGGYGQTTGTAYAGAPPEPGPYASPMAEHTPYYGPSTAPQRTYDDPATAPLPPYYSGAPYGSAGGAAGVAAPPRPPRERSILGQVTASVALMVAGLLQAFRAATGSDVPLPVVPAAALLVVGVGLLVGALYGWSRWLIALGVVLALVTGAVAGVYNVAGTNAIGVREWAPQSIGEVQPVYRLGIGDATLDLSAVTPAAGERVTVEAVLAAGELTVVLPEDVSLDIDIDSDSASVTLPGERVRFLDRGFGGWAPFHDEGSGNPVHHFADGRITYSGSSSAGTIELTVRNAAGETEIRHATS